MTNTASALGLGPSGALAPLRAKWGWIVALGVVYVIAGVIALGSVVMATIASVYVVGIMMLIAGVFEVISAFQIKTWGRFLFWLALGVLYIIAGFVAFDNPLLTAVWLTLILGAALVASGIVRIFLGFNMQHGSPWIWVVVSGLITLLLGVIILVHWPVSSLWTLGIFLGVDLVFAGASWIGLGMGLRQARLNGDRGRLDALQPGLRRSGDPRPAASRDKEIFPVRWIYLAIVVVFVAALIIFVFQNTQSVDVSFLALGVTLPLAILVLVAYVLGALSGGSLYALLRRSVAGSRRSA